MILRLIDVCLIVLFGFMCISKIENVKQVELPRSWEIPLSPPDTLKTITVTMDAEGNLFLFGNRLPSSFDQVERILIQKQMESSNEALRVRIRADRAAPMRAVKLVATLCDRMQVERSLEVIKESKTLKVGD